MAFDYREAFEHLGPNNPLKTLSDSEKSALVCFLEVYLFMTRLAQTKKTEMAQPLEEIRAVGVDARSLAQRIRRVALDHFVGGFRSLPATLEEFAKRADDLVAPIGKPGHKPKHLTTQFLMAASEYVRMKMGHRYDEHLAEVLQAVPGGSDPDRQEDISGASIQKKRDYMEANFAALYSEALGWAKNAADATEVAGLAPPAPRATGKLKSARARARPRIGRK